MNEDELKIKRSVQQFIDPKKRSHNEYRGQGYRLYGGKISESFWFPLPATVLVLLHIKQLFFSRV